MIFSRIPSMSTIVELLIIIGIIIWVVSDPKNAGAHVGGLFHSISHGLSQVIVFCQSI